MKNEDIDLIKKFKIDMPLSMAIAGLLNFAGLIWFVFSLSLAERANAFYWGTFLFEHGSIGERLFDILMLGLLSAAFMMYIAVIISMLRKKDFISVCKNKIIMPKYFPGYYTTKEILFADIQHISIQHWVRRYAHFTSNYWCLFFHLKNGKKYKFAYHNKRKARFDEIHELIKSLIPAEAHLPPPKQKKLLFQKSD